MTAYEIMPATLCHLRALAGTMRAADRSEIEATGEKARHVLFRLWRQSSPRRAALVEGELAAVWGCTSPPLLTVGEVWAFTTPAIERVPLAFFRETKREVADLMQTRHALVSGVMDGYDKAIRFFGMVGFKVGVPTEIADGAMFRTLTAER